MWATDHLKLYEKVIADGWDPDAIEEQLTQIEDLDLIYHIKIEQCEPRYDEASDRATYNEVVQDYPNAHYASLIDNLMRARMPKDGDRRHWFMSVETTIASIIRRAKVVMAARVWFFQRYAKDLDKLFARTVSTDDSPFYL
jgi:hypothetical protein